MNINVWSYTSGKKEAFIRTRKTEEDRRREKEGRGDEIEEGG